MLIKKARVSVARSLIIALGGHELRRYFDTSTQVFRQEQEQRHQQVTTRTQFAQVHHILQFDYWRLKIVHDCTKCTADQRNGSCNLSPYGNSMYYTCGRRLMNVMNRESWVIRLRRRRKLGCCFARSTRYVIALVDSYGGDGTGWWTLDNTLSKLRSAANLRCVH